MNIAVAGTGYVGMSIATLLAQHNHVVSVDVIPEKVETTAIIRLVHFVMVLKNQLTTCGLSLLTAASPCNYRLR